MDTINLGKITIPIIKPEKGIDYYTPTEKQGIITEVLENVNSVIAPQEQARQSAEISRTEAETQRQLNESTRQSNEVNREDAEELRASAEITRQSNEADRISAEETRDSTFTSKMEAVDDAIADIQDKTTAYNNNATQKTADFNDNATSKINAFNLNATNKTNDFNDNVTSKIADFDEHVTEFQEQIDSKQDEIDSSNKLSSDLVDDTNHTHKFVSAGEKETWDAKYNKPSGGIPKTDLTTEVQTSLEKADTALQQHQDISGKEDKSNKVTSIDDESTDIQYPSAKCVYDSQQNQNAKIVKLELENERLKQTLPTTTGTGENITLNKTAELDFVVPPLPRGNTVQDGEPTPSAPVEVQVVKGDVEVKVENKNLFDIETTLRNKMVQGSGNIIDYNGTYSSDFIKVKPNTNYISNQYASVIVAFDENKNSLGYLNNSASVSSFVTPSNCYYLRIRNLTASSNMEDDINKVQLEQNTTSTSYVEHAEKTYPLTLGNIELCKIGDYKDYFYKNSGKWYLHKRIGEIVLDGTETILSGASVGTNTRYIIGYTGVTNVQALCNQYKYLAHYTNDSEHFYFGNNQIIIFDSEGNDVAFKNKLATNKPEFYYILAEPIDIEITDTTLISQLEAINNAISYYEQTNISGTSSGISPLFDVEAYQSTKLLLEDIINSN